MTEPYVIKMPQLSDTMTEGVVVSWEKAVGDKIERGDIVATVETDKAIMDVEVFRDGYLSASADAAVDSTVPVGEAHGVCWLSSADDVKSGDAAPLAAGEVAESSQPGVAAASQQASAPETASGPEAASYTITMPQLSDTMTEGVVVSWEKAVGAKIKRGTVWPRWKPTRPLWMSRYFVRVICLVRWQRWTLRCRWGARWRTWSTARTR